MGCPLRWCWEEAGGESSGFVVTPLSPFIHARFVTCLQHGQEQCQARVLILGCCDVGTVSLCLETR